jgi:hypothetical protein
MEPVLTAIVSPKVLGVMLVIILVGAGIMTKIVHSKYEWTPEREKELEESASNPSAQK